MMIFFKLVYVEILGAKIVEFSSFQKLNPALGITANETSKKSQIDGRKTHLVI